MENKNIFWQGLWANVKSFLGKSLMVFGVFFGMCGMFIGLNTIVGMGVVMFFGGIWIVVKGSEQRFDYQRQSGTIVHGGDW